MKVEKTTKILTILLVMQWAFVQIIAQYPSFVEKYYANGLYVYISNLLRFVLGWVPFSIGDFIYTFLIFYILKSIFIATKKRKINFKKTFFKTGAILSILFFFFHLNWGLNYFRTPLFERLNFNKTTYSNTELIEFTETLITKINTVHTLITQNDTLVVAIPFTKNEIKQIASNSYKELEKIHPEFNYKNTSIKSSLFSLPLTYMGFAGYISPLTNEAQVNYLIPKNNYPATSCHEIAHQLGIASEKEANFVGYLAATTSKNKYVNYSGYLMALRYCLFEIYRKQPEKFEALKQTLNKGILKDIQNSQKFWQSYQNWSEQFFKIFYDSYLKANKQQYGINGYNKVVLLLINYHSTKEI
ncbi:Protein of unknown function [Lutibacter agarilyticus]|uniref:Amino acid permease n=1 Tax=Lutibacter agarilyticus TaxID=1109740 RepID=A0A238VHH0_9FLAO|nr:DUF3810 domain-containing protein [Lutibacter agarilyticus]SNR33123.1 Protein of unknown function [Lutibacter agarilyticus]